MAILLACNCPWYSPGLGNGEVKMNYIGFIVMLAALAFWLIPEEVGRKAGNLFIAFNEATCQQQINNKTKDRNTD